MRVLVVGDGLVAGPDPALKPVDGKVDLRELRGGLVLLVTVEGDPFHRVLTLVLNEVARLHEHAARAAGGIEDDAVVGLDDVDDGLDYRWRREELAVVVCALLRELRQEVLVDAPEHVARGRAQRLGIEGPHHLFQDIVFKAFVLLRKLARERREAMFYGFHGGGHRGAEIAVLRQSEKNVIARLFRQHQRAAPREIGLDQRAFRHLAGGPVVFDRPHRLVVAVGGMPQEDQAQDGQEVFVRREIGIGAQVICDFPEVRLKVFDVCKVIRDHSRLNFLVD